MSRAYYLICDLHKERTEASRTRKHPWALKHVCDYTLKPFIVSHVGCVLRVISDQHEEAEDPSFTDWTMDNLTYLIVKEREIPRYPMASYTIPNMIYDLGAKLVGADLFSATQAMVMRHVGSVAYRFVVAGCDSVGIIAAFAPRRS